MPLLAAKTSWREQANCIGHPLSIFFGESREDDDESVTRKHRTKEQTEKARSLCLACPVRIPCREWAISASIPYGVLGGLTEKQRRALVKSRETKRSRRAS